MSYFYYYWNWIVTVTSLKTLNVSSFYYVYYLCEMLGMRREWMKLQILIFQTHLYCRNQKIALKFPVSIWLLDCKANSYKWKSLFISLMQKGKCCNVNISDLNELLSYDVSTFMYFHSGSCFFFGLNVPNDEPIKVIQINFIKIQETQMGKIKYRTG